jgi:DNA (cytosine-5)-methyltransferase 1
VDTTKTITHIGLCAGYGGIELGLKRVLPTLRSVALCEIEAFPIANLVAKMEAGLMESAPIWTDLKTFPWESFRDRVDILTGGYPCQPFSAAGKRAGKEDPRHLWPWIADGIRILRPRVCFFENVEGHISLGLSSVISDLEEIGYQTAWGIFSAREVGAPHQRKRVFILGYSNSTPRFNVCGGERIGEELHEFGIASSNHNLANSCGNGHDGWPIQDGVCGRSVPQLPQPLQGECAAVRSEVEGCRDMWPSRPGQPQHGWEPPRVVGNAFCQQSKRGGDTGKLEFQTNQKQGKTQEWKRSRDASCDSDQTVGNAESEQSSSRDHRGQQGSTCEQEQVQLGGGDCGALRESNGQTQPPLGRNPDGTSDWMDDAELYTTCDNRTDELRSLGNGVVPATAERAFRTLLTELLTNKTSI